MIAAIILMKPTAKTPQKPQTAPATSSFGVRMATASPTDGNVTGRTTVGTGLMRRIVEIHIFFPSRLLGPPRVCPITTAAAVGPA
uniref:Alternative protein SORL1 n=1 Tax=Homo sapiens TaxID=9606 RepID=L8EA23_HUMAN|nr:alternative protein SORL1 [Homo sapiens]